MRIYIYQEDHKLYQNRTGITITDVDRKNNTVRLIVNGSYVEAIFSEKSNPEVFDQVKQILIGTIIKSK